MTEIEIRYFDDCPNWQHTLAEVGRLVDELGIEATISTRLVETQEAAVELSFRGSPTVIIDGDDPFADPDAPVGLACRIYRTADGMAGSPSAEQLKGALVDRSSEG